ncbi:MgtC/SapB family protein [Candidatus Uhrbacteria bacterium]|nr:MgtC/SapB family protein [Candidatus Uhrbacteria bacterium]
MFFPDYQIIGQLVIAALLGGIIGFEREWTGKSAGLRTYALVALGACLFSVLSEAFSTSPYFDPSRVLSQIVVGVGFIGAGLIIVQGGKVRGLTTAAGLWITAAIGAAVGLRLYSIAIASVILTLLILWGLRKLEFRLAARLNQDKEE